MWCIGRVGCGGVGRGSGGVGRVGCEVLGGEVDGVVRVSICSQTM